MRILWFNNGGHISGWFGDKIQLTITSGALAGQIKCPVDGYDFQPGTAHRFNKLWFAVDGAINIQILAKNFLFPNSGVSINTLMTNQQYGYYSSQMSIQNMKDKTSVTLGFQGISLTVQSFTLPSDYYILVQYMNQNLDNNTYSMDSDCQYVGGNYANLLTAYNIIVLLFVLIIINILV